MASASAASETGGGRAGLRWPMWRLEAREEFLRGISIFEGLPGREHRGYRRPRRAARARGRRLAVPRGRPRRHPLRAALGPAGDRARGGRQRDGDPLTPLGRGARRARAAHPGAAVGLGPRAARQHAAGRLARGLPRPAGERPDLRHRAEPRDGRPAGAHPGPDHAARAGPAGDRGGHVLRARRRRGVRPGAGRAARRRRPARAPRPRRTPRRPTATRSCSTAASGPTTRCCCTRTRRGETSGTRSACARPTACWWWWATRAAPRRAGRRRPGPARLARLPAAARGVDGRGRPAGGAPDRRRRLAGSPGAAASGQGARPGALGRGRARAGPHRRAARAAGRRRADRPPGRLQHGRAGGSAVRQRPLPRGDRGQAASRVRGAQPDRRLHAAGGRARARAPRLGDAAAAVRRAADRGAAARVLLRLVRPGHLGAGGAPQRAAVRGGGGEHLPARASRRR